MQQIELLDLIVEPDEFKVYRVEAAQKEIIDLPKLSFELLMYLINNAGKVCSLDQISEAVWGRTVVNNETIVQRVTLLRKALNDDPKDPRYIESVRGRGYRLINVPVYRTTGDRKMPYILTVVGLLAIGVVGAGYWMYLRSEKPEEPVLVTSAEFSRAATNPVDSLIDRGNFYFDIGQKPNIDRAIALFQEALVMEPDNQAALVGLSLAMSKAVCRYNQPRELALEANLLAAQAVPVEATSSNKSRAEAALAYSWDCLGNLDRALVHYLRAINLDPDNYSSIGSAAHLFEIKGDLIEAYQLSVKAKQLKPDNHMAELQMARIYELLKFTVKAQDSFQELFVLYPDNVFINEAYPRFLYFQGQFSEAKIQLDKVLNRGIERSDIFLYYGELVWLLEGKEQALAWFEKAVEINPGDSYPNTIKQLFYGQLSNDEAGRKILELESYVNDGDLWPINFIEASLIASWALDDQKMAIALLQKAVDLGYLNSEYLTISPLFANLNGQPEFYQLIDEINRRREHMHEEFLGSYPPPEA